MIRILTRQGDLVTSSAPLAAVERAIADPMVNVVKVTNALGYDETIATDSIAHVWEAGPIEWALGLRRTAKEVVLVLIHSAPEADPRRLHQHDVWHQAGWPTDPHPHTIHNALQQLETAGELTRANGRPQLTTLGARRAQHLLTGQPAA